MMEDSKPKIPFKCQLAQGSQTNTISGFTHVREMYQKIADCFSLPVSEIMFCTINSQNVARDTLLKGRINSTDFIYAHVKGKTKEVTLTKHEEVMGVTVIDNGTGYAFIIGLKENGIFAKHPSINIGDHIEQIDTQSTVGMTHFEVAKILKDIPKGSTFKMYLVEPKQTATTNTQRQTTSTGTPEQTAPTGTSVEQTHSKAQVHIPSVDLTGDKSCSACQINETTNPAVVYCKECREFYCSTCRDCHKAFKLTREHVLVTLSSETKHVKDSDLQEVEHISGVVVDLDL